MYFIRKTAILALLSCTFNLNLSAQDIADTTATVKNDSMFHRRITVVDIETMIPISGVNVRPDGQSPKATDYLGRVELTERFDSIRFSHVEYMPERLSFIEFRDTMYLYPRHNQLDEVVVMGVSPQLRKAMKASHERNMAQPVMKGLTFDFGMMLDKRGRRDRKRLKRAKEVLREWDLAPAYKEKEKDDKQSSAAKKREEENNNSETKQ